MLALPGGLATRLATQVEDAGSAVARLLHHAVRFAAAAALAALLSACGSAEKPKPKPLESLNAELAVGTAWSIRLAAIGYPLSPAVRGDQIILAGGDGAVLAIDAGSGKEIWRGDVGAPLAAGVGSDGRYAAVVTRSDDLVVLDKGRELWRKQLTSRTTAAPLVAGERVFVLGVDRAVHAFDVLDGRKLWALQRPGDALTLLQPGVLAAFRNTLVVGQGSALLGVDPLEGRVRWEAILATPRGTNEVERLADLVGPPVRLGTTLCARAFQSAVGCVDAEAGKLLWSRNAGGTQPLGGDAELLVGVDASDRITAWRSISGEVAWTNEKLLYRSLSAPLALGRALVLGDFEGQVHFLARDSGRALARAGTDDSQVVGAPVLAAGLVVVVTRSGGVFALRVQ